MDIRTELVPGGKALRLIESADAQIYVGGAMFIGSLIFIVAGLFKMDILLILFGSGFAGVSGWGVLTATSYETVANRAERTIKVESRNKQVSETQSVRFDEVEAVEFHNRRKSPPHGKSFIAFLAALRLKDGSRVPLSTDWGYHRAGKLRAANALARFVNVPCNTITEDVT